MNVSVIIPLHNPDLKILKRILKALKKQEYRGKIEIIKIDKNLGLADSLNYGIKKAKYPIVVSLHQDCIPSSKEWLKKLVGPLISQEFVASVSKVELPYELWKKFDLISKIMSLKEQKIVTPLLDEKGCAYRKSALIKAGLFDGKIFRTAGEDFDMWIKLRKYGKIAHPDVKVLHYHYYDWRKRLKKELQLSNGSGALIRIYGKHMPFFLKGILKSIPLIGAPLFLSNLNVKRIGLLILMIPLSLILNMIYSYGFWKGFLMGRQTV